MNDPRPAFLFYVRDFFSAEAVELMSFEEVGLYLFLLGRQWETGSIPADANALRTLCRRNATDLDSALRTVLRCFEDVGGGRLQNRRLEFERARIDAKSDRARTSAKTRWDAAKATSDANALRTHSDGSANALHLKGREGKGIEVFASVEPKPPPPAPTKPRAKPNQGAHVRSVEIFQRVWARLRCGAVLAEHGLTMSRDFPIEQIPAGALYMPVVADWTAAARLWKQIGGNEDLLRERMANFFDSDAPYMRAGGFALFASKFSLLVEPIRALKGTQVQE